MLRSSLCFLALFVPCAAPALGSPPALQAADRPTVGDVRSRLDAGELERAHALLTELLVLADLDAAGAERAAGRDEQAWHALQRALRRSPTHPQALVLRRELAGRLLGRRLDEARELVRADNPRDAMIRLDQALELDPRDPEVRFLRGECTLRIGLEDGDVFAFGDARDSFLKAARSGIPEGWSGAAYAYYLLSFDSQDPEDLQQALELSLRGEEESAAGSERAALMDVSPGRVRAEVTKYAHTAAVAAASAPSYVARCFDEARAAVEALIGGAPEDPWAWTQLADLLQKQGLPEEARETLLRALAVSPEEPELHQWLTAVARQLGGTEGSVATYRALLEDYPEVPIVHWYLATELMESSLDRLLEGDHESRERFDEAERAFARCRELRPEYDEACRGREALCRAGAGWCLYHGGDLEAARARFVSMEECLPGGLTWQYPGKLLSGVQSLQLVIGKYMERAQDPELSAEEGVAAWEQAAELSSFLHDYAPEDPDLANDAGFLNRDAGVELEQRAERLLRLTLGLDAGQPAPSPEERARARERAEELLARARTLMEASYRSYVAAAALAPEDARVVNDTGLILTYYLQRDLDAAKGYLRRSIEVGSAQLAVGIEDEAEREVVTEAVGDAHQNLGVIALTLEGDAPAAREWFVKSIEIGPFPRPQVERLYLPLCGKVIAGELDVAKVKQANYWAELEPEKVIEKIRADEALMGLLFPERG